MLFERFENIHFLGVLFKTILDFLATLVYRILQAVNNTIIIKPYKPGRTKDVQAGTYKGRTSRDVQRTYKPGRTKDVSIIVIHRKLLHSAPIRSLELKKIDN